MDQSLAHKSTHVTVRWHCPGASRVMLQQSQRLLCEALLNAGWESAHHAVLLGVKGAGT